MSMAASFGGLGDALQYYEHEYLESDSPTPARNKQEPPRTPTTPTPAVFKFPEKYEQNLSGFKDDEKARSKALAYRDHIAVLSGTNSNVGHAVERMHISWVAKEDCLRFSDQSRIRASTGSIGKNNSNLSAESLETTPPPRPLPQTPVSSSPSPASTLSVARRCRPTLREIVTTSTVPSLPKEGSFPRETLSDIVNKSVTTPSTPTPTGNAFAEGGFWAGRFPSTSPVTPIFRQPQIPEETPVPMFHATSKEAYEQVKKEIDMCARRLVEATGIYPHLNEAAARRRSAGHIKPKHELEAAKIVMRVRAKEWDDYDQLQDIDHHSAFADLSNALRLRYQEESKLINTYSFDESISNDDALQNVNWWLQIRSNSSDIWSPLDGQKEAMAMLRICRTDPQVLTLNSDAYALAWATHFVQEKEAKMRILNEWKHARGGSLNESSDSGEEDTLDYPMSLSKTNEQGTVPEGNLTTSSERVLLRTSNESGDSTSKSKEKDKDKPTPKQRKASSNPQVDWVGVAATIAELGYEPSASAKANSQPDPFPFQPAARVAPRKNVGACGRAKSSQQRPLNRRLAPSLEDLNAWAGQLKRLDSDISMHTDNWLEKGNKSGRGRQPSGEVIDEWAEVKAEGEDGKNRVQKDKSVGSGEQGRFKKEHRKVPSQEDKQTWEQFLRGMETGESTRRAISGDRSTSSLGYYGSEKGSEMVRSMHRRTFSKEKQAEGRGNEVAERKKKRLSGSSASTKVNDGHSTSGVTGSTLGNEQVEQVQYDDPNSRLFDELESMLADEKSSDDDDTGIGIAL